MDIFDFFCGAEGGAAPTVATAVVLWMPNVESFAAESVQHSSIGPWWQVSSLPLGD